MVPQYNLYRAINGLDGERAERERIREEESEKQRVNFEGTS